MGAPAAVVGDVTVVSDDGDVGVNGLQHHHQSCQLNPWTQLWSYIHH